jgi:hypothetical protein
VIRSHRRTTAGVAVAALQGDAFEETSCLASGSQTACDDYMPAVYASVVAIDAEALTETVDTVGIVAAPPKTEASERMTDNNDSGRLPFLFDA